MRLLEFAGPVRTLLTLLIAAFALSSCASNDGWATGINKLNVGYGTKAGDVIDLKPNYAALMNYNKMTKPALLGLRSKSVAAHPELVEGTYAPSPGVFQFEGKASWYSMKGYIFRNMNAKPLDGPSRESAYYGNPFMLVVPEFYGANLSFDRLRFPDNDSFTKVYPLLWPPTSIKIFPKEKREEITYDLMAYFNFAKSVMDKTWKIPDINFDLIGYNAEDFGYHYLYIDAAESKNLGKMPPKVLKIDQAILVKSKDTCAQDCNDSYSPDELKHFNVTRLPAKCHMLLWNKLPVSHLVPCDFQVDLIFN